MAQLGSPTRKKDSNSNSLFTLKTWFSVFPEHFSYLPYPQQNTPFSPFLTQIQETFIILIGQDGTSLQATKNKSLPSKLKLVSQSSF